MRLNLYTSSGPHGTHGFLKFEEPFRGIAGLWTIEQPWKNNRRYASCFPGGFYALQKYSSAKYPDTWAFVGETVAPHEENDVERFACVFHVANYVSDVQGCVGVGMQAGSLSNSAGVMEMAVLGSGDAMGILRDLLKSSPDGIFCMVHRSF